MYNTVLHKKNRNIHILVPCHVSLIFIFSILDSLILIFGMGIKYCCHWIFSLH